MSSARQPNPGVRCRSGGCRSRENCPQRRLALVIFFIPPVIALAALNLWNFPTISLGEIRQLQARGNVCFIDVNGTATWQHGHVPGAIDFHGERAHLAALLPADLDTPIVTYCRGPFCHAYRHGAKAIERLGYTNVKRMRIGIEGWREAGMPTQATTAP